jgi:hypothetical protein
MPDKEALPDIMNYFWAYKSLVNIRESNTAASKKIGQLSDGDSVLVVSNENGWYKIQTDTLQGFIRSDLLGPKNLSTFRRAFNFANELKKDEQIDLFFDKKLHHKRIFISLPAESFTSPELIRDKVEKLLEKYQQKVYWGHVTAVIFEPGTQEEYLKIEKSGQPNAEVTLPILPFGQLLDVYNNSADDISLTILTPDSVVDQDLLHTSRSIVAIYPITYKNVELTFISRNMNREDKCRLWFKEDSDGETFKFNHCPSSAD